VEGNADRGLGVKMRSGILTVNGDAKDLVGEDMMGGEIHIKGGIEGIGKNIEGGEIIIWREALLPE
jgi:formylmethanofuran dehydrogenase subunit C